MIKFCTCQPCFQENKLTQVTRPNPPNFGPGFVSKFSKNVYACFTFCFEGLPGLEMLRCLFLRCQDC